MQAPANTRLAVAELEFVCEDGPSFDWAVAGLYLDEAVNQPYEAVIDLECRTEDPAIVEFLGCGCELLFLREAESRRLYGIVSRAEHLGSPFGHQHIRLTVVPAWSLVDAGRDSRIFQEMSVKDIVGEVLEAALGDYERELSLGEISRGAATRDYCVQYRESDCDFATRLLEEEGISYAFEHEEGAEVERLVLRDANEQYPQYENLEGGCEVPVIFDRGEQADVESISKIGTLGALTLTTVARRDFDWLLPDELLTQETGDADTHGHTRKRYIHGARRYIADDQAERVADRLEAEALDALVVRGRSNVTAFCAGLRFELTHPTMPSLDGEYLLTRVVHEANPALGGGEGSQYSNEFECIPVTAPLRPRKTVARPRVHGPQTAIVVGDEDIHSDEHGRIQVQFHWEESPSNAADASCWIRCAQSFAGMGWGAQFIPRTGMEVVVEFLEGNPDRPLVTGCVYNGAKPPPFALPDDKTQSGLRTCSVPGGEGYHELRFEDAAGCEEIYLRSQRDWAIEILNDKSQQVGHDETREVANDRTLKVGANQYETIGENHEQRVGKSQLVEIGTSSTTMVEGSSATTVGEDCKLQVKGELTTAVEGNSKFEAEDASWRARGKIQQASGAETVIEVGDRFALAVKAKLVIEGQAKGRIELADELVLACGDASIKLESSGNITLSGKDIKLNADGDIKLKGSQVGAN